MAGRFSPGVPNGNARAGATFKAGALKVSSINTILAVEAHDVLRLKHLRDFHGLSGHRAAVIAFLAFGGGAR